MACEYEDRDREASKTRLHTKVTLYRQYKDELSSEKKTANASLSPSLARSREAHFACPNRRACSQAIERQAFYYPKITKLLCLQRCVACEVRVNLNYSTEVHFTQFYWFKSRTWQRKSNRACAKVTWKTGKQETWQLILRWRKEHSGLHSRGRSNSATYHWNGPGFKPFTLSILLILICKCWLLTSSWGTRASYSDTSWDSLF